MVGQLRLRDIDVPIVMVSGIDRTGPALAAGADRFLLYDEWLMLGTLVKDLLESPRPPRLVTFNFPANAPGGRTVDTPPPEEPLVR
jgi:hypothetical protein